MNRQGPAVPNTMRGGIPGQFVAQQQPQHGARGAAGRMPNGKQGAGGGWALGSVQMGNSGMGGALRPQQQQQHAFQDRMVGSGPATPLDLSEFPQLGSNAGLNNPNAANMWAVARNMPSQMSRNQTPLQTPQPTQEDSYLAAGRIGGQGGFRFGANIQPQQPPQLPPQQPQAGPAGTGEEFPPLNKNAGGDQGQERGPGGLPLGYSAHAGVGSRPGSSAPTANGLMGKADDLRRGGPSSMMGTPGSSRNQTGLSVDLAQKNVAARDESSSLPSAGSDGAAQGAAPALGAPGFEAISGAPAPARADVQEQVLPATGSGDLLEGMSDEDKWGIKGLKTLLANYPDYNTLILGIDPAELGLDLNSTDLITTQQWSVFDSEPPRPSPVRFRLPECYRVNNVAPVHTKVSSFTDETLFYIFYGCTRDIRQHWAASELFTRSWRWNRKHAIWLTKDELTAAHSYGNHERGIYVIWDTKTWRRERRELVLHYADLDSEIKSAR